MLSLLRMASSSSRRFSNSEASFIAFYNTDLFVNLADGVILSPAEPVLGVLPSFCYSAAMGDKAVF
jgi:hypothetical protein